MRGLPVLVRVPLAGLLGLACGGDDLLLPSDGAPSAVAVVEGDGQQGVVGAPLPDSLRVKVTDAHGRPVAGLDVVFVPVAAPGASVRPDTARTDATGEAGVQWVLGTTMGGQRVEARVLWGGRPSLRTNVSATALPGPASELVLVSGNRQAGGTGTTLPESLVVRATDRFGNPAAGVTVSWSPDAGSVSSSEGKTGADGRTAVEWTLGLVPGSQTLVAHAARLDGSPLVFEATATVAPSPHLAITTQPPSDALIGVPLSPQPVLRLTDASGAPISQGGVAVTAAIASGGGTLTGTATRSTDASGVATFTDLAILGTPGTRTLIFAASGYTAATSTPIDLSAPSPGSVSLNAGNAQVAIVLTAVPVPPAVRVLDRGGAPLQGVTVTFTVASGGGSATGGSQVTDQNGIARVSGWTLGQLAGPNTLVATVAGSGVVGNPVTFLATGVPGAAYAGTSTASVPDGMIFSPTTIVVRTYDQYANRITVGGATVGVSVSGANNQGQLHVTDQGDGTYHATYYPFSPGNDQVTVTVNGIPLPGSPFTSRVAGLFGGSATGYGGDTEG